ncbi:MAG: hypothetical protein ERJ69_02325 [Aphanocapsa feldmannii 288cV]|nr:MAG: hypothetical protein ERJ69_02325 [Aphanocapsa feldmannii 288cV]
MASRLRFSCPCCDSPSPEGELERWGWCGFCQREQLSRPAMGDPGDTDRQQETVAGGNGSAQRQGPGQGGSRRR